MRNKKRISVMSAGKVYSMGVHKVWDRARDLIRESPRFTVAGGVHMEQFRPKFELGFDEFQRALDLELT